jgi:hypothetical protein
VFDPFFSSDVYAPMVQHLRTQEVPVRRWPDLGLGDFVKVDCAACHYVALLTLKDLVSAGLSLGDKVLDLKGGSGAADAEGRGGPWFKSSGVSSSRGSPSPAQQHEVTRAAATTMSVTERRCPDGARRRTRRTRQQQPQPVAMRRWQSRGSRRFDGPFAPQWLLR